METQNASKSQEYYQVLRNSVLYLMAMSVFAVTGRFDIPTLTTAAPLSIPGLRPELVSAKPIL